MTDDKAKYILHEIKSLRRYQKIIQGIDLDLKRVHEEIRTISEPSCPQGYGDLPKVQSHKDKTSIVNSLMTDEWELLEEKEKFIKRRKEAEDYYIKLKVSCSRQELDFADAFFRGVSYKRLSMDYHYENPYEKVLNLIKKSDTSSKLGVSRCYTDSVEK